MFVCYKKTNNAWTRCNVKGFVVCTRLSTCIHTVKSAILIWDFMGINGFGSKIQLAIEETAVVGAPKALFFSRVGSSEPVHYLYVPDITIGTLHVSMYQNEYSGGKYDQCLSNNNVSDASITLWLLSCSERSAILLHIWPADRLLRL